MFLAYNSAVESLVVFMIEIKDVGDSNEVWYNGENISLLRIFLSTALGEMVLWLLANWKKYDRCDSFSLDYEPNEIQFGS